MLTHLVFVLLVLTIIQINNAIKYPWLEQMIRQEQLSRNCYNIDNIETIVDNDDTATRFNRSDFDHLLVDHRHKLLYCYVPKVACTNWKRVFMVLNGRVSENITNLLEIPGSVAHADNSTQRLSQIGNFDENIENYLNNYLIFLIVRHPFERLLSAYRNKFEQQTNNYFHQRYGRDIIKKYRKNATIVDLNSGNNVRFDEFVEFLLDDNNVMLNEHWMPIYNLCHPCRINYTFIGRYETLLDDYQTILNLINLNSSLKFPITRQSNTNDLMKYYYRQLSIGQLKQLYRLYWFDFKLFGYNLEEMLGFDFAL